MQWTGLNELREKYLSFFESKGHLRLDSFPLVPKNDPSLLLINSGMAPMKKWFLAQEEPPRHRVTTCQKCIRTPDIERVGITARHGTFFEMLGNFSFQDYFKEEVIPWAWEFLTSDEWMAIPKDKLHISVYEEDDEAYDIWTKKVGIAPDHMVRLGKEDNFWEHGSGPCGPCSEIYFDRGPEYGCGKPTCGVGCDCDRFMEIWNLVFSQYDADGKGNYELLAKPNIDTGMGLERLAVVMQDVNNLFEVDTVAAVLHHVERIAGKKYGENEKDDISIRVITDHIRATVFMASDGILPSNEGRGYVMRRLLRRAARHGRMLGINRPFLTELVETVIESSEAGYPELREHESYIKKVIGTEELRFGRTIDAGLNILTGMMGRLKEAHEKVLSGVEAFKLNDTFGFPLDLTREIAAEAGFAVDEAAFHIEMTKQRERARAERRKGEQLRRDGAPARGDRREVGEAPGSALLVHGEPADDGGHERHEGAEELGVGVRAQRRVPSGYGEVLAAGKTGCQAADEVHRRERGARQAQGLGEQGPRESHARRRVGGSCHGHHLSSERANQAAPAAVSAANASAQTARPASVSMPSAASAPPSAMSAASGSPLGSTGMKLVGMTMLADGGKSCGSGTSDQANPPTSCAASGQKMPASMPSRAVRKSPAGIIHAAVTVLTSAQRSIVSVPATVRPCEENADPAR